MKVIHYLAEVLKDTPLFDNDMEEELEDGAVYNDFDCAPMDTLMEPEETENFSFSQFSPLKTSTPISSIEEAVDSAVMDADRTQGVLYDQLQWESPHFDNESETCDDGYCTKVFNLVTNFEGAWDEIVISENAEKMFHRRLRMKWSLPDSVFDAWLLRKGWKRGWFDIHNFSLLFPDYEDRIPKSPEPHRKRNVSSSSDDEILTKRKRQRPLLSSDDENEPTKTSKEEDANPPNTQASTSDEVESFEQEKSGESEKVKDDQKDTQIEHENDNTNGKTENKDGEKEQQIAEEEQKGDHEVEKGGEMDITADSGVSFKVSEANTISDND